VIEYHDDDDGESQGNRLRVWIGETLVDFSVGDKDEWGPSVAIPRDSVAALVGQLQSWLARTAPVEARP
jgi:hypothetical protein